MAFLSRRFSPSLLRPLRGADAEACAAIHAASFAHPWPAAEFEALIANASVGALAAVDSVSKALRGFSLARCAADEAEILTIAVAARFRRRGVGRALLERQSAQLAASGVRNLFLEVETGNAAALALYARMGFARIGERPGYYKRPAQTAGHALVLKKTLA
jgi:[ribosomal protein S18]-alanine N-acetyltransferase